MSAAFLSNKDDDDNSGTHRYLTLTVKSKEYACITGAMFDSF